jgi:MFS transporter, DHA2 family, multidrug resistance protein
MNTWLTSEENSFTTTRQLALIVRRQAEVMALADVFFALTVVFLGCVGLAGLMRRPAAAGGGH